MPKIIYIEHDGTTREIEADSGMTVMEAAVENDIEGVVAECGGGCSCATCHCYVDPAWYPKLPPMEEIERVMLECAWEPRENSRLTCQIEISEDLDGMVVRVPAQQN